MTAVSVALKRKLLRCVSVSQKKGNGLILAFSLLISFFRTYETRHNRTEFPVSSFNFWQVHCLNEGMKDRGGSEDRE